MQFITWMECRHAQGKPQKQNDVSFKTQINRKRQSTDTEEVTVL